MKVVVTGAGITGACAANLLKRAGHDVEIFETRHHIGGNCYDENVSGVTVHRYGPHVFHTNSASVWKFLSRFTRWYAYEHKVVADTSLGRIPIPWSGASIEAVGRDLTDREIQELGSVDKFRTSPNRLMLQDLRTRERFRPTYRSAC